MSQLTFVEKDVEEMKDFINFVASKAEFTLNTQEAFKYSKLYQSAINTLKKMDAHVFELKEVIEPNKKAK